MKQPGRQVNLVSIGIAPETQSLSDILVLIEKEGTNGTDLIVLPEICMGYAIQRLDGEAVTKVRKTAARLGVYIVFPVLRYDEKDECFNSAIMIDRKGNIMGIYDKIYPYWDEFNLDPPVSPGKNAFVFDTDFGRIGIAICFDANFPEVFRRFSDQEAELVLWSSAYTGGVSLQAHAINHNYYIVTSTLTPDCLAYDITGREMYYQKSGGNVNIGRLSIDLDRRIFHCNFNIQKRDKLLKEHAGEIEMDAFYPNEHWFTLKAIKPGVSVRTLAAKYGMEELSAYKKRSRDQIDKMRETRRNL